MSRRDEQEGRAGVLRTIKIREGNRRGNRRRHQGSQAKSRGSREVQWRMQL